MVATTAATTVPTTAAVEGITAGDFVPEVSWLDMRPEPIIPSNTNFLKYKRKPANDGRSVHVTLPKAEAPIFRRRHPGLAGIALGIHEGSGVIWFSQVRSYLSGERRLVPTEALTSGLNVGIEPRYRSL